MQIRRARESDIDDLLRIEKACFKDPWSKTMFLSELRSRDYIDYFVITVNEKIIAFLGSSSIAGDGEIRNFAVDINYRRKKVASFLLDNYIKFSKDLFVKNIYLEVRLSNNGAIELYKKFGFEIIGKRKNYYSDNEDAHIMCLELEEENENISD